MLNVISEFAKLTNQKAELETIPKLFNALFAEYGWIAYETMSFDVMKKAVELGQQDLFDDANKVLIDYYADIPTIQVLVSRGSNLPAYLSRKPLVLLAQKDYAEQRYYSCVLLLLSIVDGLVKDVAGKGFFAENTDVTAWNSIAGADTGLTVLQGIMGKGRRKTTSDEITIPYRNGILHGRDLNYNNITVAAKCWGLLAAIVCWGKAVTSDEYKASPAPAKPVILTELLRDIKESFAVMQKNAQLRDRLDNWKPRDWDLASMGVKNIASITLPECSPERAMIEFLELWEKKNYGNMRDYFDFKSENSQQKIEHIKRYFSTYDVDEWEIKGIEDKAACITEILAELILKRSDKISVVQIRFRMFYNGENVINGDFGGKWEIVRHSVGDNRFEKLELLGIEGH